MKIVKVSYARARSEGRRDRRYPLPPLTVTMDQGEWTTENWSLGGFLISNYDGKAVPGEEIAGFIRVAADEPPFAFNATVVRIDDQRLGAQFRSIGEAFMVQLDRVIARRHGIGRRR
jgi:hypothetical protein